MTYETYNLSWILKLRPHERGGNTLQLVLYYPAVQSGTNLYVCLANFVWFISAEDINL